MKQTLLICILCLCSISLNAQITVMNEDVQEKIIAKPQAFDSLSNITHQSNPIQYKKYIGYKLYCLPFSNKNTSEKSDFRVHTLDKFKYMSKKKFEIPHGKFVSPLNKKGFIIETDIYRPSYSGEISNIPPDKPEWFIYTPYDSIQNTYFTILNIETAAEEKGTFYSVEKNLSSHKYLRFTLRNETTGENLYWITPYIKFEFMFLVPYFEKMQKTYKGQNVVPTKKIENLADIKTGEKINIQPGEVWQCYDVTFVNLASQIFIAPYCFLEKDGKKVKISFSDFTAESNVQFVTDSYVLRPAFILEQTYNNLVAEKQRTIEERQRIEEEKRHQEEIARQEREKRLIQKYGNQYGKLIFEGKVCLKMTKEMCTEAWGEPHYINSTIIDGLVCEQWVYGLGTYLYFDNGILRAIQN